MNFAALFPGQGSQSVGMGQFLVENFNSAKLLFEEASDTLKTDFQKLCFTDEDKQLDLTANTQPALLLVSTATYNVVSELTGAQPTLAMGHSIGEYAALVTSGSLKFADAIKAVRTRGEAMQSAVPVGDGGMVAVMGLTADQVKELCQHVEKASGQTPLEPANYNAPGQIVISGNAKAIEWAVKNVSKDIFADPPARMKLIPLKVSAPFHCSMMKPAEEKMSLVLNDTPFENANWSIIQNFSAEKVQSADTLRSNLIYQVSGAVRWIESVDLAKTASANFIEFGTGKVLAGLLKKIDPSLKVMNTNSLEDIKKIEQELQ